MEPSANPAFAVKDPVCGMTVNPATAGYSASTPGDITISAANLARASLEPILRNISSPGLRGDRCTFGGPVQISSMPGTMAGKPVAPLASKGSYVCPMCPEVHESKPGPCPSCGMALESEISVASNRVEYTCPMHPEIVRAGPGSCPICGMALEPRTITAGDEENPELRDMTRRFWISVVLTCRCWRPPW